MIPLWMKPRASFARKSLHAFAVVLPALAVMPATTSASAASGICQSIEARLASVAAAPRHDTSRLDRAVRQSRAAGCGPTGSASPHDTHCRVHAQRIHDLRHSSAGATGRAGNELRRERARLTSALRVNGCMERSAPRAVQRQAARPARVDAPVLTADGSIPVPTPRPPSEAEIYQARYVELAASRQAALDLARMEELARSRTMPAWRQDVRVVGGRFLAEPDSGMDFATIAARSESPANEILVSLLAVLKGTLVSSAIAAER
ncbi:hypothetical protein EJC49_02860 [Aquibium carbonis]|uniref:Uncharacterized protein n=1 Tax=Aquibium carbonis TaxID=2495581 RepID=A0A3S0GB92_9HYPH|nr:hypothetical protein [Aquibium carbonis]RST87927.1 hypothetical protein EJC49_02860 [Aquibium carbonis]